MKARELFGVVVRTLGIWELVRGILSATSLVSLIAAGHAQIGAVGFLEPGLEIAVGLILFLRPTDLCERRTRTSQNNSQFQTARCRQKRKLAAHGPIGYDYARQLVTHRGGLWRASRLAALTLPIGER